MPIPFGADLTTFTVEELREAVEFLTRENDYMLRQHDRYREALRQAGKRARATARTVRDMGCDR